MTNQPDNVLPESEPNKTEEQPVTHTHRGHVTWNDRAGSGLRLVVVDGPDRGAEIYLGSEPHIIGSASSAGLVLSDRTVSRHHLRIEVVDDGVRLRDLGSKNGTFLAGVRVTECTVGANSVVRVGMTLLRISRSAHVAAATAPSQLTRFSEFLGTSLAMREVFATIERIAATDLPVLIQGETGTGKEVCAQVLHQQSARSTGAFVVCDLASITRSLIESELFGHVRGAFTGANSNRDGLFVQANGGTLFIDEVGELELDLQPRLLRAIETRRIRPVGSSEYRPTNVRVIAATNRNLEDEVRAGRFRADLFHRLAVVRVELPPLRARKEDVALLARGFIDRGDITLPPETLAILSEYDWPGNVRELRNIIERAVSFLRPEQRELTPDLLGLFGIAADSAPSWANSDEKTFLEARGQLVASWERHYLKQLLKRTDGNVSRAARECGVTRIHVHRLIKKYGIRVERNDD